METKILNTLFLVIIVIMVILFLAIVLVNIFEEEESEVGGLRDITGAMQSFEIPHETANPQYINVKTSERFNDKYFEYLENVQKSRDKTFLR